MTCVVHDRIIYDNICHMHILFGQGKPCRLSQANVLHKPAKRGRGRGRGGRGAGGGRGRGGTSDAPVTPSPKGKQEDEKDEEEDEEKEEKDELETPPKTTAPKKRGRKPKSEGTANETSAAKPPKTGSAKTGKTSTAKPKSSPAKPKSNQAKPKSSPAKPKSPPAKPKSSPAKPKSGPAKPGKTSPSEKSQAKRKPDQGAEDAPRQKRFRHSAEDKSFARRAKPQTEDALNQWKAIREAVIDIFLLNSSACRSNLHGSGGQSSPRVLGRLGFPCVDENNKI